MQKFPPRTATPLRQNSDFFDLGMLCPMACLGFVRGSGMKKDTIYLFIYLYTDAHRQDDTFAHAESMLCKSARGT